MMLQDGSAIKKLAQSNLSTKEKIIAKINDLLNMIAKAFEGVTGTSNEYAELREAKANFEELQRRWNDALADATETFNGAQGAQNADVSEQYSNRIQKGMTDAERYAILKDVSIPAFSVDYKAIQKNLSGTSLEDLETAIKSKAEKPIREFAKNIKIIKNYTNKDLDINFSFTINKGLNESLHRQMSVGGNYSDLVKAISLMDKVVPTAELIEMHDDYKKGTSKEKKGLMNTFVLFGAIRDYSSIIPIQLEVMQYNQKSNTLYVNVALSKIDVTALKTKETDVAGETMRRNKSKQFPLLSASIYSIGSLFQNINSQDGEFLKYVPDQFLNNAQKSAKQDALARRDRKMAALKNEMLDGEKYSLRKDDSEIPEKVYSELKTHFGTTNNVRLAGYILRDGSMLDFSGKHWGDTHSTMRQVDHRDITELDYFSDMDGVDAMVQMLNDGNVRLMPESGGINISSQLTSAQETKLRRFIAAFNGEVTVDLDGTDGKTVQSFEYPVGTSAAKIFADVDEAFRNGMQSDSDVARFHTKYSLRKSARDYSYDALVSKPDMKLTSIDSFVSVEVSAQGRKQLVADALKAAAPFGRRNENGNVVIHVDDANTDVILSTHGLVHGLDRRLQLVAPVIMNSGEILKKSVLINEMNPKIQIASDSYVLVGAAKNKSDELYIVRFVVNRYSGQVASVDVVTDTLYSMNTKKEPAGLIDPAVTDKSATHPGSTISIHEVLEYVNRYFPDILSMDVLNHFGQSTRPYGKLGESARYSTRKPTKTARQILSEVFSEQSEQYQAYASELKAYQDTLDKLNQANARLEELRAEEKTLRDAKPGTTQPSVKTEPSEKMWAGYESAAREDTPNLKELNAVLSKSKPETVLKQSLVDTVARKLAKSVGIKNSTQLSEKLMDYYKWLSNGTDVADAPHNRYQGRRFAGCRIQMPARQPYPQKYEICCISYNEMGDAK